MAKPTGNPNGRPRKHDREQIANDMLEWAQQPDSINLNKFCAHYKPHIPPSKISNWAKEDDVFRQAYEVTNAFLAYRREEWLNDKRLHVKAYDLNAYVHDHFMNENRKEHAAYESSLKSQEQINISEADQKRFDTLMGQISSMQSNLKTADNNSKTESKS